MSLTNTNSTTSARGFELSPTMKGSSGAAGIGINPQLDPVSNASVMYGVLNLVSATNSAFNITNMQANRYQVRTNASYSGSITTADGLFMATPSFLGSTPSIVNGLKIANQGVTGVTNAYGLFIETQSGATNNYAAVFQGGNVGIGTTTPSTALEVAGQVKITGGSPGAGKVLTSDVTGLASWQTPSGGGSSIADADNDTKIQTEESTDEDKIRFDTAGSERMIIDEAGNVGIGEPSPAARLVVRSTTETNIIEAYNDGTGAATGIVFRVERETGDVYAAGVFNSGGADVAEYVNTTDTVEPGDVIEIDPDNPGQFRKAREALSPLVAGIITTDPGVVLGGNSIRGKSGDDHPAVALAGRVPVKVMAKFGAVEIGDLLVSSPFPGYAMKCAEPRECVGAIIGKIMVQVMLR